MHQQLDGTCSHCHGGPAASGASSPGKEDTRTVWIFVPLSAACLCVVGRLAVRNVLPAHLRDGNAGGRPADQRGIFFLRLAVCVK